MQSRAVIEQVKGILMGQRRCTSEQAFDIPVRLSQDTNRKLREVPRRLLWKWPPTRGSAGYRMSTKAST